MYGGGGGSSAPARTQHIYLNYDDYKRNVYNPQQAHNIAAQQQQQQGFQSVTGGAGGAATAARAPERPHAAGKDITEGTGGDGDNYIAAVNDEDDGM